MIDTIVLTLSKNTFQICSPEKFTPSANWILNDRVGHAHGIYSKQNPTTKELRAGIYKPRLTLSNRITFTGRYEPMLKIEVSLPKLMFGNNFEELRYKDFMPTINKLVETLSNMGVNTTSEQLAHANVSTIHYSKNIPLTDGSTPYHFINKIKEANIKLSLDVNQTDYRNAGHSYRWHCNSYEVIFYDKIKDLEKARISSKRAIEKDTTLQIDLLKRL